MKRYLYNSFLTLLLATAGVKAQNIPTGSTLGMYPTPTLITLPVAYNNQSHNGYNLAGLSTPVVNYRRLFKPLLPLTSISSPDLNAANSILVSTSYLNGWGNELQNNLRGPYRDIISVNDYRASTHKYSYLPFTDVSKSKFIFDPFNDQRNFYNSWYGDEGGTSYSDEETPNNQSTITNIVKQPGKVYVGHNVGNTTTTKFNGQNEVPVMAVLNNVPAFDGYYGEGQIRIETTTDVEGGEVKQYYNKDNLVIWKRVKQGTNNWLNTYYTYDRLGRISYIIPPKAVTTNNAITVNECFAYAHNDWGDLLRKYSPGLEPGTCEEFVYDARHRKILYRNPEMKAQDKWSFTIYDDLDRVVAEGIYYSASSNTGTASGTLGYYMANPPNNLVNITDCDVLVFNTYDGTRIYTGNVNNNMPDVYYTSHNGLYRTDAGAVTPVLCKMTHGLLTGSAVKVVDASNTNNQLGDNYTITQYDYDKKGQLIQTRSTSPWGDLATAKVITSYQYDFSGRIILKITGQTGPNDGQPNNSKPYTRMQNAWHYDMNNNGRLWAVKQKMDNEDWRVIATYNYDELGRVNRKMMGGVENQYYTYDMRGALKGINADYVDNGYQSTNLPARFGVKIFNEYGFANTRKDGKASGIIWRGAGVSAVKHAYGYEYNDVGQLTHAEFREYSHSTYIAQMGQNNQPIYDEGLNWNKQHKDYTATNMVYDANGNMLSMTQVGVPVGYDHPVYIDVMKYFYGVGNRQIGTGDAIPFNYHLDEFVDGTCEPAPAEPQEPPYYNKSPDEPDVEPYFELGDPPPPPTSGCADYSYDKNGNLTHDGNKWMFITYNYMNLPVDITVLNGSGNNNNASSTVHNVYDGSGALLRKVITDNTVTPAKVEKYDYLGAFTYRNDSLLDVTHEEGKARYEATPARFTYDYFTKDHLGNVRAVINAMPADGVTYVATYELASANLESSIFSHINQLNSARPDPNTGNMRAAKLNGAYDSTRIGTSLLLSVMPEDQFEFSSLYYYEEDTAQHTVTSSTDMLGSLISTLTGGVGGYSGNEAADEDFITRLLDGRNYTGYFDAIKQSQTDPSRPMAYLNYMVFDRNMNLVQDQSGVIQVGSAKGSWDLIEKDVPLTIGQEGYILISLSNELNWDVFFDQVKVKVYKGQIKQEQHYYPYGLAIKAGQDVNTEPCQNKYQGKELQDELNVQLYDFHARQYDPQLGKFWGLDPLDQFPSGYTGMGNDPANMVDPTGMRAERTAMDPLDDIYRWSEAGQRYFVTSGGTWNELAYSVAFDEFGPGALYTSSFEMERQPQSREAIALGAAVAAIINNSGFSGMATTSSLESNSGPLLAQGGGTGAYFGIPYISIYNALTPYTDAVNAELDNYNSLSLGARGLYGLSTGKEFYTGKPQSWQESTTLLLGAVPIGTVTGAVERNVAVNVEKSIAKGVAENSSKKYVVYEGIEKATGKVMYVGMTSQNPAKRFAQHLASRTEKAKLLFRVVPGTESSSRIGTRIVEQKLINHYGLDHLLNQRNSIAPKYWSNYGIK